MKRIYKIIIYIAASVIMLLAITVGVTMEVAKNLNEPPETDPEKPSEVIFEVRAGETAQVIGKRLEDEGLIKSRHLWYVLNRLDQHSLKAGTYRITMSATQEEIHSILVQGSPVLVRVTIPEGVTIKKTARILADAGICTEEDFLQAAQDPAIAEHSIPGKTLEGYLYPDTYLFQENYPADKVVRKMADTFFERLAELTGNITPGELFDKVRLASIVEREYRVDEEAALMAGVFYNRLSIGMALQSCATVEYVITEIQGKPHPEVLYTRDTEIDNPYNTYMYKNLPPGPISNPGMVALSAVFNPIPSDYLYFRLIDANAGRHYFSRTFDDHIKAGELYVKK